MEPSFLWLSIKRGLLGVALLLPLMITNTLLLSPDIIQLLLPLEGEFMSIFIDIMLSCYLYGLMTAYFAYYLMRTDIRTGKVSRLDIPNSQKRYKKLKNIGLQSLKTGIIFLLITPPILVVLLVFNGIEELAEFDFLIIKIAFMTIVLLPLYIYLRYMEYDRLSYV